MTLPNVNLPFIPEDRPISVLFVCLGNICRSPAAEGIMRDQLQRRGLSGRFSIDSAGTGDYHIGDLPDRRMRIHARERGIELNHRCRQVRMSDFRDFDLIIPMDTSNHSNLIRLAPDPEAESKIVPISAFFSPGTRYDHVPDPYYEGSEGFELVLDLLEDATSNLIDTVIPD